MVQEAYEQLAGDSHARSSCATNRSGVESGCSLHCRRHGSTTSAAACRPSVHTATNWSCGSTASPVGPTPPRASNARWRSRCVSPGIGWSPSGRGARRSSSSTTCCPNSTTGAPRALLGHLPDGQVVITTASELPPAARADRILRIEHGAVATDILTDTGSRGSGYGEDVSDPVPITRSLDSMMKSLRGTDRIQVGGVFGKWDDAVGRTDRRTRPSGQARSGDAARRSGHRDLGDTGQVSRRHDHHVVSATKRASRSPTSRCESRRIIDVERVGRTPGTQIVVAPASDSLRCRG